MGRPSLDTSTAKGFKDVLGTRDAHTCGAAGGVS